MRKFWGYAFLIILISIVSLNHKRSYGKVADTPATVGTPAVIATFGGYNDQRDIDYFPQVAYDSLNQRFLVIWLTPRNVSITNTRFDVYGIFLEQNGLPESSPFQISDTNSVARNGAPAIAAGNGEFVVVWTNDASTCQLVMQKVTDSSAQTDQLIPLGGDTHLHSPDLVYNPTTGHYVVAYVAGDDYLPPAIFGANINDIADCGNNQASSSEIKVSEFHFDGNLLSVDKTMTISAQAAGAFRPKLAYDSMQNAYFALWEDRRNAGGNAYHFAVYGQALSADLANSLENIELHNNSSYDNGDNSAVWTPRPAIVAGNGQFLATWFEQAKSTNTTTWSVQGRFVSIAAVSNQFLISRMTYMQSHTGNAPAGFLMNGFATQGQEFLIALSSHSESPTGYLSSVRVQRIDADGQLLRLDGSQRSTATIGDKIDLVLDTQLMPSLISYEHGTDQHYLIVYSKHAPDKHMQDFDIWSNQIVLNRPPTHTPTTPVTPAATATRATTPTPKVSPTATKTVSSATPVITLTPPESATPSPTATPTIPAGSNEITPTATKTVASATPAITLTPSETPSRQQYLPLIVR